MRALLWHEAAKDPGNTLRAGSSNPFVIIGSRDAQDGEIGIVGFEIPFNRHFYVFRPPRPLEAIDADIKACTDRIKAMIEALSV